MAPPQPHRPSSPSSGRIPAARTHPRDRWLWRSCDSERLAFLKKSTTTATTFRTPLTLGRRSGGRRCAISRCVEGKGVQIQMHVHAYGLAFIYSSSFPPLCSSTTGAGRAEHVGAGPITLGACTPHSPSHLAPGLQQLPRRAGRSHLRPPQRAQRVEPDEGTYGVQWKGLLQG